MSSALKENPEQAFFHDEASLRRAEEKVMESMRAYSSELANATPESISDRLTLESIKEQILIGADRFLGHVATLHCLVSGESRTR